MDVENFLELVQKHWKDSFYSYAWHTKIEHAYAHTSIEIAPVKQQCLGGRNDGKIVIASFFFNLSEFIKEKDIEIENFGIFSKLGKIRDPYLLVKGKYQGFLFHLSIFQLPPKGVEISEYIDSETREVLKKYAKKRI